MPLSSLLWRRRAPPPLPTRAHLRPPPGLKSLLNHPLRVFNPSPAMSPSQCEDAAPVGWPRCNDHVDGDEDVDVDVVDEEEDEEDEECCCWGYYGPRHGGRKFPPAMQVVAKLEAYLPRLMPRVLKRTYEAGGRLVIREIKLRHHEFMRALREDGRLRLELVHIMAREDGCRQPVQVEEGGSDCTCSGGGAAEVEAERCEERRRAVVTTTYSVTEAVRKGCLPATVMFRMAAAPPMYLVRT